MIRLHFLGANRAVTGSRYCLEVDDLKLMVDCGMFHERQVLARNWQQCPLPAAQIDAMLLTHVHIDHSGLIPRLVNDGFRGPIYCTSASSELVQVLLRDSAHIQVEDAKFKKKRHQKEGRSGTHPEVPLYTEVEVVKALPLFGGIPYGQAIELGPNVSAVLHEAGHILGSASVEVIVRRGNENMRILFSGDLGQKNKPLIRDPEFFEQADYVVMETTYGNRDHPAHEDVELRLEEVIQQTVTRGGNVVIPTFAVERAQDLMYYISRLVHANRIPPIDVFLDSPMAIDITEIFRHYQDCFDDETWRLIASQEPPLRFPGLHMVRSVADSKELNDYKKPCVIMATAGMCTAGRIKHHLRANIGHAESTILFVGYQAQGTLGRQILDGNSLVRIHGRQWKVKARIERIEGFSGHADRTGLMQWISNLKAPPRHIFLTHGEEQASLTFAKQVRDQLHWPVSVPHYGDVVDLA